jgi:hypothetical protein
MLTDTEIEALYTALDDEHKAWATYAAVLDTFGEVRPFCRIIEAEARHIRALEHLLERHGVDVPPNDWVGRIPRYSTLADACRAGVEGELANEAMYDRLLESTTHADIRRVFRNLQEASREHHLPAFRRCLEGGQRGLGGGAHRDVRRD